MGYDHYVGGDSESDEIRQGDGFVVVCGYGRIGRLVCELLGKKFINFVAFDNNPLKAMEARNRCVYLFVLRTTAVFFFPCYFVFFYAPRLCLFSLWRRGAVADRLVGWDWLAHDGRQQGGEEDGKAKGTGVSVVCVKLGRAVAWFLPYVGRRFNRVRCCSHGSACLFLHRIVGTNGMALRFLSWFQFSPPGDRRSSRSG